MHNAWLSVPKIKSGHFEWVFRPAAVMRYPGQAFLLKAIGNPGLADPGFALPTVLPESPLKEASLRLESKARSLSRKRQLLLKKMLDQKLIGKI
jgi:hypothetical protein